MINIYLSNFSDRASLPSLGRAIPFQKLPHLPNTHLFFTNQTTFSTLNQTFTYLNETFDEIGNASPYIKSALVIGAVFLGIELLQAGVKGIKHLHAHKDAIPYYTSKSMQLATTLIVKDLPLVQEFFSQSHQS